MMFYELIYTRCRHGIDILNDNRPILSDGYKVYSCSNEIVNENLADLQLLNHIAQSEQSFDDPDFMDDAYLYLTPDTGMKFMDEFHPITFNRDAEGDYSHRPGNFINQIFIGDFQDFYPYELFRNNQVWNAKERGEAYYYSAEPEPLPARNNLIETGESISVEEISKFVSDGRREVVKKAVSFLLLQFSVPPEERTYIVVKDENSKNIELWIAAIENAFSPRMAAGLSFATRLDNFERNNRYTVNLNGQYQPLINLQDPNQKVRYHAMIVGVNEMDRANAASVNQLEYSTYGVLDGLKKVFSLEEEISDPYFSAITAYDDRHIRFCHEFLQMLDICEPGEKIKDLYAAFNVLDDLSAETDVNVVADALGKIENIGLCPNSYLQNLYRNLKSMLPALLRENSVTAFFILNWLKDASVVDDENAANSFNSMVCDSFIDTLFYDPVSRDTSVYWENIRTSNFYDAVVDEITQDDFLSKHKQNIDNFRCNEWISFLEIYLECFKTKNEPEIELYALLNQAFHVCHEANDSKAALKVCALLNTFGQEPTEQLLIEIIANGEDTVFSGFVFDLMMESCPDILSSDDNVLNLCRELQDKKKGVLCPSVLLFRAKKITNGKEQEDFIRNVLEDDSLKNCSLSHVYESLDSNISISDEKNENIASIVQEKRPANAALPHSAHICACMLFDNIKKHQTIKDDLQIFVDQGFPSVEDPVYAERLIQKISKCNLDPNDLSYVINSFSESNFYLDRLTKAIMEGTTARKNSEWNTLLSTINAQKDHKVLDSIVNTCMEFKHPEKEIERFEKATDKSEIKIFEKLYDEVSDKVRNRPARSKSKHLFGVGSDKSDDSSNKKKKK